MAVAVELVDVGLRLTYQFQNKVILLLSVLAALEVVLQMEPKALTAYLTQ